MAKKPPEAQPVEDNSRRVSDYLKQYQTWKTDLKSYWTEMDRWQEMYEFHKNKSERSETDAEVSLNTPFAMVESQIAKENQASVNITVKAKPDDDIGKFDRWVETIIHDAIFDPDIAEIHGTFRKTKEKFSRALKVVGNAAAEINYCYKTAIVDGEKKVVADNPYTKTRSYKSIIFNPAMQFDRSDLYYVEDWVDFKDLKKQESKDGKGLYTNLGAVKLSMKDKTDNLDDTEEQYIAGDQKITKKKKPLLTITRWEGTKMTVIAVSGKDSGVIIREEIDPLKLGGHNLILGMRYIVEGRPYAYGEIAAIYKPVRAQDTIVSQGIDIVNKYLRGSYILGPGIDIDQFMMVLANGGAMEGNPQSVVNVPVNQPPAAAFQSVDVLQQAIERAGRFSLYSAGLSGQATDKTKGTASGIQSIQAAAEPNVEIQLDDLQDMFMQPIARKYLKCIARLMGSDEVRYGLMQGEDGQWVKATKGILMGKATIADMVQAGLLSQDEAQQYLMTEEPVIDPMTGQPALDAMGQPQMQQVPIPGAEKALVFDVDWLVEVKLDNQSAADKEEKNQKELALIQLAMQMGVQMDPKRIIAKMAHKQGFDDIEELFLTPEEEQQQQQEAMQQQQGQLRLQQQQEAAKAQQDMQGKMMDQEHQMQLEAMKQQGGMAMAQMKQPMPPMA